MKNMNYKSQIYTKKGDKGETGILGQRISKASDLINLIGTVDEFNALIGVVVSFMDDNWSDEKNTLTKLQDSLFVLGSTLAGNKTLDTNWDQLTQDLEKEIDTWESKLPTLTNFILPGGSNLSALIHLARTVCRRVERQLTSYVLKLSDNNLEEAQKYINRLSDWLFTLARVTNHKAGKVETIWKAKL